MVWQSTLDALLAVSSSVSSTTVAAALVASVLFHLINMHEVFYHDTKKVEQVFETQKKA